MGKMNVKIKTKNTVKSPVVALIYFPLVIAESYLKMNLDLTATCGL